MQNANPIEQAVTDETAAELRTAGVAGAGGAGFPSYAKWQETDGLDYLLVNHQESEPVFYGDVWLLRNHAEEFATLFDHFLSETFDAVVVATKQSYRHEWLSAIEAEMDADIFDPGDLPIADGDLSGVSVAYTDDMFQYGMEQVLLKAVADTVIGNDLPTDYGWVVHNTETLYNIYRALTEGLPVTDKLVHVCGDVADHRFFRAPIGTPATELLAAAGAPVDDWDDGTTLATGGPGWCFETEAPPDEVKVGRHTNGLIVTDDETIEACTRGNGRVNLLEERDWKDGDHETEPTSFVPDDVRLPLITNDAYEGLVDPSKPVVQEGHHVARGDPVAAPADGLSIARHAPIPGTVTEVSDSHIEITKTD
jgi:Na+-translocating ferredoxin:NAD+ oxidoreductase RnfC subunit